MATSTQFDLTADEIQEMDSAAAKQYVKRQFKAVADSTAKIAAEKQNNSDRAAYATYLGEHVTHEIFQEKRDDNKFTNEEWAQQFGLQSKSLTTGWRTLGHALVEIYGGDRTNPDYVRMRNSNAYAMKDVKDAVMDSSATPESVVEVLNKFADADGKRIPQKRDAQPDDGEGVSPREAATALLVQIEEVGNMLSFEEWEWFETKVRTLLNNGNTERAASIRVQAPAAESA